MQLVSLMSVTLREQVTVLNVSYCNVADFIFTSLFPYQLSNCYDNSLETVSPTDRPVLYMPGDNVVNRKDSLSCFALFLGFQLFALCI